MSKKLYSGYRMVYNAEKGLYEFGINDPSLYCKEKNKKNKTLGYKEYSQSEEAYTKSYIDNTKNIIYSDLENENITLKTIGRIAYSLEKKAVTSFINKKHSDRKFRELVDQINDHIEDDNFYNFIMNYKKDIK